MCGPGWYERSDRSPPKLGDALSGFTDEAFGRGGSEAGGTHGEASAAS